MADVDLAKVDLADIDKALQIAHCLRLGEWESVADVSYPIFDRQGDASIKLDAFLVGGLDAVATLHPSGSKVLYLLVYALAICEIGPGAAARDKTAQLLRCESDPDLSAYFKLGRLTVFELLSGQQPTPGRFARLLRRMSSGIAPGRRTL